MLPWFSVGFLIKPGRFLQWFFLFWPYLALDILTSQVDTCIMEFCLPWQIIGSRTHYCIQINDEIVRVGYRLFVVRIFVANNVLCFLFWLLNAIYDVRGTKLTFQSLWGSKVKCSGLVFICFLVTYKKIVDVHWTPDGCRLIMQQLTKK